ncbi:MAG: hypothetical protein LQ346_005881 [Caloplaca aetnensis]|nr:MAG: hypothetical protein LQ346_005881 [Caloplaca aetnensis]
MVHFHIPSHKTNVITEPQNPPAGFSPRPELNRLPTINTKAAMAPDVESPLRSSSINKSGRSTPKPHQPAPTSLPATESPADIQTLMAVLNDFTQSVLETAIVQSRVDILKDEEKQIHDEHERWSKYASDFTPINEDQSRTLKAIQTAKEKSQDRLNQAKTRGEKATKKIARTILAAGAAKSVSAADDEQIASLKNEIAALRNSVVGIQSDHHHLIEVSDDQQHHSRQLQSIREDIRQVLERQDELDKKKVNVPELSSVHDGMKHMSEQQARHLDSIKSDLELKIKNVKESVEDDRGKVTPIMLSKLEADLAVSREALSTLEKSYATKTQELEDAKSLLGSLQREVASNKQSIQRLDDRVTENSSAAKLEAAMQEANSICQDSHQIVQTCTNDIKKFREDQDALGIRCHSIEQVLVEYKNEQQSVSQGPDFQNDLSDASSRIGIMEEKLKVLSETVANAKAAEEERDAAVSDEIEGFNNTLLQRTKQFEEIQKSEFGDIKGRLAEFGAEQSSHSSVMENIKADIVALNEDINSVKGERAAQQPYFDQLDSTVALLQRQVSHQPPTQPSPSPSLSGFKDDVQPKIEALETRYRDTVDKVKAIETFQASQEQRWNNVTTEPMVQSVLFHMNQRYPLQSFHNKQEHLAHRIELVDTNRSQDLQRIGELEKVTRGNAELLSTINSAVASLKGQVTRVDKSVFEAGLQMEAMKTRHNQTNTQNLAAIQSIKTGVSSLEEKYSSALDSHRETWSELQKTVQDLQKTVDGELLSRKAHDKSLDEKVSEVYDVTLTELTKLDRKVLRLGARVDAVFPEADAVVSQQEVEETQGQVREASTEICAPGGGGCEGTDSDVPIKARTKRQSSRNSSNMPPRKKRKGPFSPDDSGAESYKGDIHGSRSPHSVTKLGRGTSQQQQQQQGDSLSSSQARRPRKPND